jgi:hypothetical protein
VGQFHVAKVGQFLIARITEPPTASARSDREQAHDHRPRVITFVLTVLAPRKAETLISCFEQLPHELRDAYHEASCSAEPDQGDADVKADRFAAPRF